MKRVRRSLASREDVSGIWSYIAGKDIKAAEALIETFDAKLRLLASNPMLGQARPELAPSLRSFTVGNYLVFYTPEPDGIFLIRVLHGSRDVRRLL